MNLSLRLSTRDIKSAVSELKKYRTSFDAKCEQLVSRLAAIGVNAAVMRVRKAHGVLASSIRYEAKGKHEYVVVCDGRYAAYVEFGTGVVGSGTYPGELPNGWSYDERRTPLAHDPLDPAKWYYYDESLGHHVSTYGQTANAFMQAAAHSMRDNVMRVAREVFV